MMFVLEVSVHPPRRFRVMIVGVAYESTEDYRWIGSYPTAELLAETLQRYLQLEETGAPIP